MNSIRLYILPFIVFFYSLAIAQDGDTYRIQTVVIDAGHGGKDPGALGHKVKEKDVTLAIALKLGKYIEEKLEGVKVIYTRKTDSFVELHKRAEIANKNHADLFISIHANANTNSRARGTDTWVMGLHKTEENLEVAKLENQVILIEEDYSSQYQGIDPNESESYIIVNLMQNVNMDQSLTMAALVQDQFRERVNRHDRGVKTAPFIVLWNTAMPSILVETGFITNPEEAAFLRTDNGQDLMASAIFRAFRDYKNKIESKSVMPKKRADVVEFKVQVFSSNKQPNMKRSPFKEVEGLVETVEDGIYKYTKGNYTDYKDAVSEKDKIKAFFPEAFIVAFKNGEKVPVSEVLSNK